MSTSSLPAPAEALPPPFERYTLLGWLLRNLFSTWYNALLTVLCLALIALAGRGALEWGARPGPLGR